MKEKERVGTFSDRLKLGGNGKLPRPSATTLQPTGDRLIYRTYAYDA